MIHGLCKARLHAHSDSVKRHIVLRYFSLLLLFIFCTYSLWRLASVGHFFQTCHSFCTGQANAFALVRNISSELGFIIGTVMDHLINPLCVTVMSVYRQPPDCLAWDSDVLILLMVFSVDIFFFLSECKTNHQIHSSATAVFMWLKF